MASEVTSERVLSCFSAASALWKLLISTSHFHSFPLCVARKHSRGGENRGQEGTCGNRRPRELRERALLNEGGDRVIALTTTKRRPRWRL